ncbi:CRTAC1 family protein [Tuwongella immobilis]|nr:CRTAC1 family protein [Tuwongella immobilis]
MIQRMVIGVGVIFVGTIVGILGCRPAPISTTDSDPTAVTVTETGPLWFEDISSQVGLTSIHDPGPTERYFMPASMAAGAAVLDVDGDGRLDLYLLNNGGPTGKPNQLLRQRPDGSFENITDGSGADLRGDSMGLAVADINHDGLPDLCVTQYGATKLLLNRGGKFEDISQIAGITNPLWGMSAVWFDYDRDGWLDLFVANYLDYDPAHLCRNPKGLPDFCGPNSFQGVSSKLFRHQGLRDGVPHFRDVSIESGIAATPGPGLGVVAADFTGDGWCDLFVANDGKPNRLWVNQRDGRFADEAISRGLAYTAMGQAYAGMGIALGDVDRNGFLDLFVTHLGTETHTLWKQGPAGMFRDRTNDSRLLAMKWRGTGFGTLFSDFDCDGHLDLAIVNGRVATGGKATGTNLGFWETYAERNQLFRNDGAGQLQDVSQANPAFSESWNVARGLLRADFDGDGGVDLLVTRTGQSARLFRNVAKRGHWLAVRAMDPGRKRDAYGAQVSLRTGDTTQVRLIQASESYLSSSQPVAHFGLGAIDRVDAIEIRWPNGATERFAGGAVDRLIECRQGEGTMP